MYAFQIALSSAEQTEVLRGTCQDAVSRRVGVGNRQ